MGFATKWLEEKTLFPELFDDLPDRNTGIIVVIPAYDEPDITILLDSLALCTQPFCGSEVIVIVNSKENADRDAIENNRRCIDNIESWKKNNPGCFFRLFVFDAGTAPVKGWGVGLARKTGMDEAVRRLNTIGKPEGVIVCLDADCTVEKNYFAAIAECLLDKNKYSACSIYFEHPLTGRDLNEEIYEHIILYELHLRYFIWALKYSDFPYAFYTVGSAIAVKAYEYVRIGGMNRRQAGEDFYFVQKLVQTGGYFALNKTTVYPSPRESLRVPFGTGATISRMLKKEAKQHLTYNFNAFTDLKMFFGTAGNLFRCSKTVSEHYYSDLPAGLRTCISEDEWITKIEEINSNTSSYGSFIKRFFAWFNMFRTVKYLNSVHENIYPREPVGLSASRLLRAAGHKVSSESPVELLNYFRLLDKNA